MPDKYDGYVCVYVWDLNACIASDEFFPDLDSRLKNIIQKFMNLRSKPCLDANFQTELVVYPK